MANAGQSESNPFSFLLICQSYPPVIGGSEIEAQRVCSELIRRGHRVTVVCAGGSPMPPLKNWIDSKGVPVRMYAARWTGHMKNVVFALRVALMMVTERRNYQAVYFLMQGLHLAIGLPVAQLLNKPVIMKIAGSGVVPAMHQSRIGRLELRWLNRWAKTILILNEGMREEAVEYGISPEKLAWMPNPVDTVEFSPSTEQEREQLCSRFKIPRQVPIVLYSGRLAPEKALPTLLEAFAAVLKRVADARLFLVGDGPMHPTLREQAAELQIPDENIRFVGRVEPQEVSLWLKVATVFVLVSPSEGFSCALEEAMSCGVPNVVTDIPANRQLLETDARGIFVPVGDASGTASAIVELLKNADLRKRLGTAAREHIVASYSMSLIADRYEALFRDALKQR